MYLGVLLVIFLLLLAWIIYPYLNRAPTCTDGKQNGAETGVDCGGSCLKACILQVDQLSIFWSRAFKVVDGRWNAVAYLENHNPNTVASSVQYRFRFADANNVYIGKRDGSAYVPPSGKFAIFEPAIDLGNSTPVYTSFEFTEIPVWLQVQKEKIEQFKIFVSDIKLTGEDSAPKLSATVKNTSLFQIPEVNFIAILYDEKGNAINASRTYLDKLRGEEINTINFTWPEPFDRPVIAKEIIPIFNIFSVKLN